MNPTELLESLSSSGIRLEIADNGMFDVFGERSLTDSEKDLIRRHKSQLLEIVGSENKAGLLKHLRDLNKQSLKPERVFNETGVY